MKLHPSKRPNWPYPVPYFPNKRGRPNNAVIEAQEKAADAYLKANPFLGVKCTES